MWTVVRYLVEGVLVLCALSLIAIFGLCGLAAWVMRRTQ